MFPDQQGNAPAARKHAPARLVSTCSLQEKQQPLFREGILTAQNGDRQP